MSAGTTPMLEQYWRVKSQHPDKLVFFRLGDFYELFYEDAQIASRVLELTLTARENKHERIPMCGVPYHAAETYLSRLIERGYKVVICDQVEDARRSKGLVRREVVRVVTPGTLTEGSLLEDRRSNYLVALYGDAQHWALAAVDLLTGECQVTATPARDALPTLIGELHRLRPAECLLADGELQGATGATRAGLRDEIERIGTLTLQPQADFAAEPARRRLEAQFGPALAGKIVGETPPPVAAALGALLAYLTATQQQAIRHLKPPRFYQIQDYLVIDATARQHLELTRRLAEGKPTRAGTLLAVLDHTLTAMGGRRLEAWLEQPLVRRAEIEARLDAVEQLWRERAARDQLRQRLSAIYDLERLAGRIALGSANARELLALRRSLEQVPAIKTLLQDAFSAELLIDIERRIDPLTDVHEQLASLVDDPPPTITEGGLFRDGHHAEIDSLRQAARHGRQWLADLERDER
ncbi:MAG TPA: DNA mismatch repair protein MutS, partial [Bacillota bacterium]